MTRTSRRMISWVILLSLLACGLVWLHFGRAIVVGSTSDEVPLTMSVTYTHQVWHGKPIYVLKNASGKDLQQLTLYSWSEQKLSYLYVGKNPPTDLSHLHLLENPPYTFPMKSSVWFIGPSFPPSRFTVVWSWDGKEVYATAQCLK